MLVLKFEVWGLKAFDPISHEKIVDPSITGITDSRDASASKNKLLEKTTNKKDWCCKSWKSLDGYETAGNLNWLVLNRIEVRLDSAETSAASSHYFLKFMLFLWLFKLQCLNSFPFITPGAGRHFVLLYCDFSNCNA